MFGVLLILYIASGVVWLIGWGMQFEEGCGWERRRAAVMMLGVLVWPVLAVGWFLYGVFCLVRVALGRD